MTAHRFRLTAGLLLAGISIFGCATTTKRDLADVVRTKAAFELNCQDLKLIEMSDGQAMTNGFAATNQKSYGVEGCGKRASYQAYCTNMLGQENCDAISTSANPAPATAGN